MKINTTPLRIPLAIVLLALAYFTAPDAWIPHQWRVATYNWLGAASYRDAPTSKDYSLPDAEEICPPDALGWRDGQTIEGVLIEPAA
ncbi:MAG TPA: hypothetical protein VIM85_11420, partial [Pseudomonadales bacterium]